LATPLERGSENWKVFVGRAQWEINGPSALGSARFRSFEGEEGGGMVGVGVDAES